MSASDRRFTIWYKENRKLFRYHCNHSIVDMSSRSEDTEKASSKAISHFMQLEFMKRIVILASKILSN